MLSVLTAEQMRQCDRAAVEQYGIPELLLMENAGAQVVECMNDFFGERPPASVAVVCGKGNNGGDGLVVARHLHNLGRDVHVYLLARGQDLSGPAATNHTIAERIGIPLTEVIDAAACAELAGELAGFDCIVDALLGTGLTGAVEGLYADAVHAIVDAEATVVAVDVPTGLSSDTGELLGDAVEADLTVTFAAPKRCHLLPPAEAHCGELAVVDIGIPWQALADVEEPLWLLTEEDCALLAAERRPDTHKGTYGRVLVVGGAVGTAGAAVLAGNAALRAGAGLVTVAVPEPVYEIVASQLTEALVRPLPAADGALSENAVDEVVRLAGEMDALALGPGIGRSEATVATVHAIVDAVELPTVIDADGLNAFAGAADRLAQAAGRTVLTPHPGEMGRLLDCSVADVQQDRVAAVRGAVERTGAVVLLKGYRTLVADESDVIINPTGNAGMATGGTGDVLTGMVAALLGQGLAPLAAASLGAFAHGRAGDLAVEETGERALIAGDLLDYLAPAFSSLAQRDGR